MSSPEAIESNRNRSIRYGLGSLVVGACGLGIITKVPEILAPFIALATAAVGGPLAGKAGTLYAIHQQEKSVNQSVGPNE